MDLKYVAVILLNSSLKLSSDSDSLYGNTLIRGTMKNAAQHIQLVKQRSFLFTAIIYNFPYFLSLYLIPMVTFSAILSVDDACSSST